MALYTKFHPLTLFSSTSYTWGVRIELPPYSVAPEEWARMHARKYGWRWALVNGTLMLLVMWPILVFLGLSPVWAAASAILVAGLSPWNLYYTSKEKLKKDKGLP
jgi:hypothetical protein